METEKIIAYLNKHRADIIKKLSANKWRHFRDYFLISKKFSKNTLDDNFKNIFCAFYIINGPMGLNDIQKKSFFKFLSLKEDGLEKILRRLYEIPSYGKRHKLFLSFGTKLLHTIDNDLPIYDRNIAYVLELRNQSAGTLEAKIKNRIEIYKELKNKFEILLKNHEVMNYLENARKELSETAELSGFDWKDDLISNAKLLDSSLWALYDFIKKFE